VKKRLFEPGLIKALVGVEIADPCPNCATVRRRVSVNSVEFDVLDCSRFVQACDRFVECGESHVVHFLAVHPTVAARQVASYRNLLNSADLVVSDGAPVATVMRLQDGSARRVTSTDGFLRLCDGSGATGLKHYFVGGSSEGVKRALVEELHRRFPEIEIAGFEVPPFRPYTDKEVQDLAASITDSGADVVWIGIGAPKQEVLAHRLRRLGAAPMIACIGATFDFVAGAKTRAPAWMRALGLEWLFRLIQEPRRLWRRYLIGNARFVGAVAADELRRFFQLRVAGGTRA
jgi:N-acetylglucosaminyldiphosphoundecaprenol N-acetyl-beta-D-mannosaminyltransferase